MKDKNQEPLIGALFIIIGSILIIIITTIFALISLNEDNSGSYIESYEVSYQGDCRNAGLQRDNNLNTGIWTSNGIAGCNVYENWSIPPNRTNPYFNAVISIWQLTLCWDYNQKNWIQIAYNGGGYVPENCLDSNKLQTQVKLFGQACIGAGDYDTCPQYVEGYMEWHGQSSGS